MMRAFLVGVAAGGGFLLANNFVPHTSNSMLDTAINLAAAGVVGAVAIHFLHKR